MPVYEYECDSCKGRFEVMQKFSDPLATVCQICHASAVRKVLSPTSFVLKGSGWYATDYASADKKKSSETAPAPAAEAKPAACGGCAGGSCPSKS
ncbi:MAG: zinc ribbon domain-containing protein [Nitrospirota bacterium]|nr:zinc ribbon domain-containing protein [Nitrospirota bacterium]